MPWLPTPALPPDPPSASHYAATGLALILSATILVSFSDPLSGAADDGARFVVQCPSTAHQMDEPPHHDRLSRGKRLPQLPRGCRAAIGRASELLAFRRFRLRF